MDRKVIKTETTSINICKKLIVLVAVECFRNFVG